MKFSEMSTKDAFDVIAQISPDVAELAGDEEIAKIRKSIAENRNFYDVMADLIQLFTVKHKAATVRILAALEGKTVDELMETPFEEAALHTVYSSIEDVMLLYGFFLRMALLM